MGVCPYCNDSGFIGTSYIEKEEGGHRSMIPFTEPCHCRVNISISKKFGILSPVSPAHPTDSIAVHKVFKDMNVIFLGSEDIFLYLVKCYFLTGFMYKNYIVLEGGTVVEQYNVPKDSTGDWLTTSHLNQYDLLALMFTTSARYTTLKDCVLEVIKNRGRLAKSTWIFSPSEKSLKEAREYSQELEEHFLKYRIVNLSNVIGGSYKLKGFKPRKDSYTKTEKDMNDSLGKS